MTFHWAKGHLDSVQDIEIIMPFDAINTPATCRRAVEAMQALGRDWAVLEKAEAVEDVFEIRLGISPGRQQQPEQIIPSILGRLRTLPVSPSTYLLTSPDNLQDIPVFDDG